MERFSTPELQLRITHSEFRINIGVIDLMLLHKIIDQGRADDIALADHGRYVTYGEFKEAIKHCRDKLYDIGIRQGDCCNFLKK